MFMRFRVDQISYRAYRTHSFLGCFLVVAALPVGLGAFWTSVHLFKSELPAMVFFAIYWTAAVIWLQKARDFVRTKVAAQHSCFPPPRPSFNGLGVPTRETGQVL